MSNKLIIANYFTKLSTMFGEFFGDPSVQKLPFQKDTHEWLNYFYNSNIFRHIHLEFYKTDKLRVLHSNMFPKPLVDLPIMGFDMIAIGDKITGLFFDFTPTVTKSHALAHCLINLDEKFNSQKRSLPDWADFFSDNFYCVTPDPSEISDILQDITNYISYYLYLGKTKREEYELNINKQNLYCEGQQKNDKTYKALAAEIGESDAKLFLQKYLFPRIENCEK